MNDRADAKPEQLTRPDSGAKRERACDVRDAFAMALRIAVLRFDRSAPMPNNLEKQALETPGAMIDVRDNACGAQLRKDAMTAVEMRQRVAMPTLQSRKLGAFSRSFSEKQ